MRWQDILTYSSGGTITLFLLFAGIFNLSGITYSNSGDSYVDKGVAYAYINISSTYWKLCFEHGKDKQVIYAKSSRSQTRYINLDKIVFSNPPVEIELQRSYFSGWKNVDEGYCIERTNIRKVNQLRLVGHNIKQTTKWNFIADYWLMKNINIDPKWIVAVSEFEECKTIYFNRSEPVWKITTKQKDYCFNDTNMNVECIKQDYQVNEVDYYKNIED